MASSIPIRKQQRERRDTIRFLINEFNDYGHRTTMHGLGHMYQSTDNRRKLFWLLITIVSCAACAVHIYFIVTNYMETPVNSVILQGRIRQEFPDVTFCNMYPISESVQYHAAEEIHGHISRHWQYFSGFIKAGDYRENSTVSRLKVARQFMQIFWASEDTRDLAHDDDLFIVQCKYKNRDCSNKQFKMVQNLDYWNCYTFSPKFEEGVEDRQVYSGNEDEGLNLILYTNSHLRGVHPDNGLTQIRGQYLADAETAHTGEQSNFLERYLENFNLSLNQLLAGDKLEPDGMRIILHEKDTYPHMDMNSVIVGNGDFSNINFYMERKLSKNRPEHPCREVTNSTEDLVEYMAYYPGKDIRYRGPRPPPNFKKFKRARLDYIVEKSQAMFWSACHCHTHVMPFNSFNSELCYYCPNGTDPTEIRRTLGHLRCHDRVYEERLKLEIFDYFRQSQNFQPCTENHYNVRMGSSVWPSQRDIQFLINQFVIPAFQHETVGNKSYNHILRKTRVAPIKDIIKFETSGHGVNWTAAEFLVRKNFLKVAIHADSPTGTLHEEVESYSFAEALSEIGGIFGLYAGVSILSFFEFIELVFLMSTKPNDVKQRSRQQVAGGRPSPLLPQRLTALLQAAVEADGEVTGAEASQGRCDLQESWGPRTVWPGDPGSWNPDPPPTSQPDQGRGPPRDSFETFQAAVA